MSLIHLLSDSAWCWLHMYTALNKETQDQERKNMIRKDDVSDNNCSKLYYDFIIIIFFAKKLPQQNILEKKIFVMWLLNNGRQKTDILCHIIWFTFFSS